MPSGNSKGNSKSLVLNISVITSQVPEKELHENFEIYAYQDHNTKKIMTFVNDEILVKINVGKLAKKKLNIKKFWDEVIDFRYIMDWEKSQFIINYYLKEK